MSLPSLGHLPIDAFAKNRNYGILLSWEPFGKHPESLSTYAQRVVKGILGFTKYYNIELANAEGVAFNEHSLVANLVSQVNITLPIIFNSWEDARRAWESSMYIERILDAGIKDEELTAVDANMIQRIDAMMTQIVNENEGDFNFGVVNPTKQLFTFAMLLTCTVPRVALIVYALIGLLPLSHSDIGISSDLETLRVQLNIALGFYRGNDIRLVKITSDTPNDYERQKYTSLFEQDNFRHTDSQVTQAVLKYCPKIEVQNGLATRRLFGDANVSVCCEATTGSSGRFYKMESHGEPPAKRINYQQPDFPDLLKVNKDEENPILTFLHYGSSVPGVAVGDELGNKGPIYVSTSPRWLWGKSTPNTLYVLRVHNDVESQIIDTNAYAEIVVLEIEPRLKTAVLPSAKINAKAWKWIVYDVQTINDGMVERQLVVCDAMSRT